MAHSRSVRTVCGETKTVAVRVTWGPEVTVYTGGSGHGHYHQYTVPVYAPPSVQYYYSTPQSIWIQPSQRQEFHDMRHTKEMYTGKHQGGSYHSGQQRQYGLQPPVNLEFERGRHSR